jgi:hypothetical protein
VTHGLVQLRIMGFSDLASVVRAFRAATAYSVREIREAVDTPVPLNVAQLFTLGHDEEKIVLRALLGDLSRNGASVEISLDGKIETCQFLENALEQWEEICTDTQLEVDLESGEPSIEFLKELRRRYGYEAFFVTLNQILRSEGYNVDEETMLWVRHELGKA